MAETAPSRLTPTLGPLFSVATVVVIVFGLQAAQAVVIPVLLALFFAMMAWPGLLVLRRHGVPAGLALLIVVSGMMVAVLGVGLLVGASMTDFASRLPTYQAQARAQFGAAMETLERLGVSIPRTALLDFIDPGAAMGLVSGILTGLSGALGQALLIFTLMLFLLIEGDSFPRKLKAAFGTDSNVTSQNRAVHVEREHLHEDQDDRQRHHGARGGDLGGDPRGPLRAAVGLRGVPAELRAKHRLDHRRRARGAARAHRAGTGERAGRGARLSRRQPRHGKRGRAPRDGTRARTVRGRRAPLARLPGAGCSAPWAWCCRCR